MDVCGVGGCSPVVDWFLEIIHSASETGIIKEPPRSEEINSSQFSQQWKEVVKVYRDFVVHHHGYKCRLESFESRDWYNLFHGHMSSMLNQSLSIVIKSQKIPPSGGIMAKLFAQEIQSFFPSLITMIRILVESELSLDHTFISCEERALCKLAECLLSIEISKRDETEKKPTNLLGRMADVKVSFEKFERKTALMVMLAFNYVEQPTLDQVEQCIEHCDLMLYHSDKLEPSDLTCMAMTLFNIFKKQPCFELLGDTLLIASFANVIDPVGAEVLMIQIGETFIVKFKKEYTPLLSQLAEFVSRRISTSNLGSLLFSADTFCEILYGNILRKLRPEIVPASSYKFGEDLKYLTSRKEFKSQYFLEDLLRIESSKDANEQMLTLYKTINTTYLSNDSPQIKAHKLALICKLVVDSKLDIDRNEFLNALLVCIHNFHLAMETDSNISVSLSSESMPISGNTLCIDLYYFSVCQLYELLNNQSSLKYPAAEMCMYFKNINNRVFQILWKKVIETLQLLNSKLTVKQSKGFIDHYLTSVLSSSLEETCNALVDEMIKIIEKVKSMLDENRATIEQQLERAKNRWNLLSQPSLTEQEISVIKTFGAIMKPSHHGEEELE